MISIVQFPDWNQWNRNTNFWISAKMSNQNTWASPASTIQYDVWMSGNMTTSSIFGLVWTIIYSIRIVYCTFYMVYLFSSYIDEFQHHHWNEMRETSSMSLNDKDDMPHLADPYSFIDVARSFIRGPCITLLHNHS